MTDPENYARVGAEEIAEPDAAEPQARRGRIEPWLSAVLQSEHLALLLGNGFTTAITGLAQTGAPSMGTKFSGEFAERVEAAFALAAQDGLLVARAVLGGLLELGEHQAQRRHPLLLARLHGGGHVALDPVGKRHWRG